MPELEALYENKEQNIRNGWRNELPLNQPVKLGRVFGHSDWWMNDGLISSFHATVSWDGNQLTVVERTPPPTNRIYYQSRPQSTFTMPVGESFVIGNTVFVLHSGATSISSPTGESGIPDMTIPAEVSYTRQKLREVPFDSAATFLRALEQIPDVLRYANDESMLFQNMVKVALDALPHADAVAIVEVPPEATDTTKIVKTRNSMQRMAGKSDGFLPSRRLVYRSIRQEHKSILHVWIGEKNENVTMRMDSGLPGIPWAICTPFKDDSGWGLYADGRVPKEPQVINGVVKDRELFDYQKVVELVAGLIESTRKAHQLDRQLTTYRRFVPRRLWNDASPDRLEEILQPKQAIVTVLFVDLRGSCRFAEDGENRLEDTWQDLSQAIEDMTSIISENDGVVAGFQGDAVMAFWGWPESLPDQIERAAKAALRIRSKFDRQGWWSNLSCGIGIAHGPAMAGRMGASDLAKVDVFGPVVNLASRLESLTKKFGVRILIDENVAEYLNSRKWPRGRTRRLGKYVPAGMTKGLVMSELMPSEMELVTGNIKEPARRMWEEAMTQFLAGDWGSAKMRFEQFFSNDPAAKLLLEQMRKCDDLPPPGWAEKPNIVFTEK
jgi:adenylate cyclase